MALEKVKKQSYEEFRISGSILKVQSPTETVELSPSEVVAVDKTGKPVSLTFLDDTTKALGDDPDKAPDGGGPYTNNMLVIRIRVGSESLSPYKVTFKMATSEGNHFEVDVRVVVKEL